MQQVDGVATLAENVNRCSGVKLATIYACNAASALIPHPSLSRSFPGADTPFQWNQAHMHTVT